MISAAALAELLHLAQAMERDDAAMVAAFAGQIPTGGTASGRARNILSSIRRPAAERLRAALEALSLEDLGDVTALAGLGGDHRTLDELRRAVRATWPAAEERIRWILGRPRLDALLTRGATAAGLNLTTGADPRREGEPS